MKNTSIHQLLSAVNSIAVKELPKRGAARLLNGLPAVVSLTSEEDSKLASSMSRPIEELPETFKLIQSGVFGAPELNSGTESGRFRCQLKLNVKLNLKDSKGVPFDAQRTYNFADSGRGRNAVIKDYQAWTGKKLAGDHLWAFDPRKFTVGKPVTVELEVRRHSGSFDLWVKAFHPPGPQVTTTTTITTTKTKVS